MNIYFSCSITGGRNDQPVYQCMVDALLQDGHSVPTAHLSDANIQAMEKVVTAEEVYQRDVEWVRECDVLVAEVSTPSHGVGYEIALAESLGKPVFCCFAQGKQISKMISGNPSPTFKVQSYQSPDEAVRHMREFLKNIP
jgi:2'-deoxynucleoside 5'-phosphate N-hydrolase